MREDLIQLRGIFRFHGPPSLELHHLTTLKESNSIIMRQLLDLGTIDLHKGYRGGEHSFEDSIAVAKHAPLPQRHG